MEYEKSASGSVYLIKSDKGYWLPGGFGYTSNKAEARIRQIFCRCGLNFFENSRFAFACHQISNAFGLFN